MAAGYDLWDAKYNRPIVGGRVRNPTTGEIEEAGPMFVAGPPSIRAIWVNLSPSPSVSGWNIIGASLHTEIDKALFQVASQVQQGIYSIVSLNASEYSITIVCKSTATLSDMDQAVQALQRHFHGDPDEVPDVTRANEDVLPAVSGVEGDATSGV